MRTLLRRLRYLIGQRRFEAELAEEIETHRALHQRELERQGLARDEATYASRRALGNTTVAREDARGVWIAPWLESVCGDVVYAVRLFRRAPAFAATVVIVMAIGIGATTGVFSLLDAIVLKRLPVHRPERLVYLTQPSFSYPVLTGVRERGQHVFSSLSGWDLSEAHVEWSSELEPAEVMSVTGDFYTTLGIGPAAGRLFRPEDDRLAADRTASSPSSAIHAGRPASPERCRRSARRCASTDSRSRLSVSRRRGSPA